MPALVSPAHSARYYVPLFGGAHRVHSCITVRVSADARGAVQAPQQAARHTALALAAAALVVLAPTPPPALAGEEDSRLLRVERAREQVEYRLGLQQQAKRAEEVARRVQLERVVEGVQARLSLKLTEERANLQAAKAAGLSVDQLGRIQQAILQLETANEELARQKAAAEAQLGQQEIADEAAVLAKQEVLAERAKAMEQAAAAATGTVQA